MNNEALADLRTALAEDVSQLLSRWELLYDESDTPSSTPWKGHARQWFARYVDDDLSTRISVFDFEGKLVATAIGTVELGVPNPLCPQGRTVRLANVITLPSHRGQGYATALVRDVIAWARVMDADRVDLSATSEGLRIYEQLGFSYTSAPRRKLVLPKAERPLRDRPWSTAHWAGAVSRKGPPTEDSH